MFLLLVVLGFFLPSGVHAGTPAEDLELYRKWHDVCLSGGVEAIDGQIKKFEGRLRKNPKDFLAQAFMGSACALRAKAGFWGPTKLKFLKRGEKLMNSAVAAAPTDPRVRMVRAIAYYRIPKRFKKRATSVADFKHLMLIAKDPAGGLEKEERQVILYYASLAFAEEGMASAKELRALCRKIDPNSVYGKKAR